MELYEHQKEAIRKLQNGNVLCGGVGSGKSRTSLAYYYIKVCGGDLDINGQGYYKKMRTPLKLYIITTARKRDTLEWEKECIPFSLETNNIEPSIDSWNNIEKYTDVKNSFFIFDEQRVVGYGKWSKSFIEITKNNKWIILTATPGDTWMDYVPIFIANGFFKNKTDFCRKHVIFSRVCKYPKVDKYINVNELEKMKESVLVDMSFERKTLHHNHYLLCDYDKDLYSIIQKDRWNPFENVPCNDVADVCRLLRKVVNSNNSRLYSLYDVYLKHPKTIVFYNFNYELDMIRDFCKNNSIIFSEWNGQKHEPLPSGDSWLYLVQYAAGAEGWNCIETDTIIFFSQSYSYKATVQAAGRIDRLNTPFIDLHYFYLISDSSIDRSIRKALNNKKDFNERSFLDLKNF